MTLCAVIVPDRILQKTEAKIESILDTIGASKAHTVSLKHAQKVYCAREIWNMRIRLFGVVSNKKTLGEYSPKIEQSSVKFYNKCAEYLLEKICGFLLEKKIPAEDVTIIFEERNHDYSALLSYLQKIQKNPLHSEAKKLRAINTFSISFEKKNKQKCFFIADFGANALYQCFNKTTQNFGIPETRYIEELRTVFHRNEKTNVISGVGIKYIQQLSDMQAEPDIERFLSKLRAD